MLALLLVGGCTVGPDYRAPKPKMPTTWISPTTQPTKAVVEWWTTFNDPQLNSLVTRAVESNLDLRQAEARIREARAQRNVVASGQWPSVNATGNYTRSRIGGPAPGGASFNRDRELYQAGFDASWELDIFGGIRRSVEAAEADIQTAVEDRRDVLVTLVSEVATNYMDLRTFQQEIAIAKRNLAAQQRTAAVTRKRLGFVSALDVANADAQVATTQSQIPALEASAQQAIYNLSVLLAREPGALLKELSPEAPIPGALPAVPLGLPSDLLRRRPDIRRAEAQLHATTARIGVATADLFPRFALTGSLGTEGNTLKSLGNWDNRFWSIGPSVTWPVFDAGRIRATIQVQNAIQEQALAGYEKTVLVALQDVESSLIAYAKEQIRRQSLIEAVAANRRAVDLSTRLYAEGLTEFLNVLSAQRSLYLSEDALAQSTRTVATNLVSLYKALGGGWEIESNSAPPKK